MWAGHPDFPSALPVCGQDSLSGLPILNIAAAGAVDRELVDIFLDLHSFGAENALTEGREAFTKVPGGRRIRSGRV